METLKKVCQAKAGTFYPLSHYDRIVTTDSDIFYEDDKGNRRVLAIFRKHIIPKELTDVARAVFETHSKRANTDRGEAGGGKKQVRSNVSGYYDRPYAQIFKHFDTQVVGRRTSFTKNNEDKWEKSLPFFRAVNKVYEECAPEYYQKQHAFMEGVPEGMSIDGTVYTTVTSNYNWRTACHTDSGDFEDGLANLAIAGDDKWEGCLLGFPEFKVAVKVRVGDCLLMNVHQYHCNTELEENGGCRLSFVCYARKNMALCKTKKVVDGEVYWHK